MLKDIFKRQKGKVSVCWHEGKVKISKKITLDKLIAMKTENQAAYVKHEINGHKLEDLCSRYILIDQFTYGNSEMFLVEKIRTSSSLNLEVPGKKFKNKFAHKILI